MSNLVSPTLQCRLINFILVLLLKGDFMTVKLQLYKCNICNNIAQILHEGEGELVCCGQVMELLDAKNKDQMAEKHVPKFLANEQGDFIQVGEILHPMLEEHYIEFIQAISPDKTYMITKFLKPNEEPKMVINKSDNVNKAYEYCNIHGLWEGERD